MLDHFLQNNRWWLLDYRVQCAWIFLLPVGLFFLPVAYLAPAEPMRAVSLYGGSLATLAVLVQLVESFSRLRRLRCNLDEGAIHDGPYVLFLRSFSQTHGYMTEAIVTSTDASASLHEESLVGDLDQAVRSIGFRLVALGGELVLPRAQRVVWLQGDDADWIANITQLAESARAILLAPDTTAGLIAETRFLRDKALLGRTIALMAPLPKDRTFVEYPQREAREAAWEQARQRLSEEGITLPVYHADGAVFRLGPGGPQRPHHPQTAEVGCDSVNAFEPSICKPTNLNNVHETLPTQPRHRDNLR